jgi:hypothetical protein
MAEAPVGDASVGLHRADAETATHHHRRCTPPRTAFVVSTGLPTADRRATDPVLAALEKVDEGDDDPTARRADRVAEGDGAAGNIGLGRVEAEELLVGEGDGAKGFVEFPRGLCASV